MNILLLETATPVCSVVLAADDKVLSQRFSSEPNAHSSRMAKYVEEVLSEAGLRPHQLDAVCVSAGPGSYTGLRIGVSSAKGFCYALSIPLISVPTLQGMAALYYAQHPGYQGLVCPMIDARRMECYSAIYDSHLEAVKPVSADIISEGIYDQYLQSAQVAFIGDGAAKTKDILGRHANSLYDDSFQISAEGLLPVALRKLQAHAFEDVAYFEPFYLKDFVAAKPVVKGLK